MLKTVESFNIASTIAGKLLNGVIIKVVFRDPAQALQTANNLENYSTLIFYNIPNTWNELQFYSYFHKTLHLESPIKIKFDSTPKNDKICIATFSNQIIAEAIFKAVHENKKLDPNDPIQ